MNSKRIFWCPKHFLQVFIFSNIFTVMYLRAILYNLPWIKRITVNGRNCYFSKWMYVTIDLMSSKYGLNHILMQSKGITFFLFLSDTLYISFGNAYCFGVAFRINFYHTYCIICSPHNCPVLPTCIGYLPLSKAVL